MSAVSRRSFLGASLAGALAPAALAAQPPGLPLPREVCRCGCAGEERLERQRVGGDDGKRRSAPTVSASRLHPEGMRPRRGRVNASRARRAAAHSAFAISRSLNFCTLPVEVFGSSVKTMWRGIL